MSQSQAEQDPQQTYTKMSVGEVEAIGSHCQAPFCGQLDFLPFRCESCKGTYCLDHRSETAHSCPKAGEWARQRRLASSTNTISQPKPNILTHESQCSHPSCKTLINTPLVPGVECQTCNRSYCLKHRLRESHDCSNLTPLGVGRGGKSDRGLSEALGRLRAWGSGKKSPAQGQKPQSSAPLRKSTTSASTNSTSSQKSSSQQTLHRIISPITSTLTSNNSRSKAQAIIATNNLKKNAKGDSKIPAEKRIYVHLEAIAEGSEGSAGAKVPRADAFYSKDWSVGKILDAAAKTLQIVNVNNRSDAEENKLRVFHVEGGRILGFGEKFGSGNGEPGKGVKNGDTLVLLRGVGAPDAP